MPIGTGKTVVNLRGDLSCTNNKLNRLKVAVELNKYVVLSFIGHQ